MDDPIPPEYENPETPATPSVDYHSNSAEWVLLLQLFSWWLLVPWTFNILFNIQSYFFNFNISILSHIVNQYLIFRDHELGVSEPSSQSEMESPPSPMKRMTRARARGNL